MKRMRRCTALLLTAVLLFSVFSIAAHADEGGTGAAANANVLVTVTTDKEVYNALEVAEVTMQVENKGEEALSGVVLSIEAENWLLARGSDSNILSVGEIKAGETKKLSLRCVLDVRARNVRFIDRILLLFRYFVQRPKAFRKADYPDKDSVAATHLIVHGSAVVDITARAWYGSGSEYGFVSVMTERDALNKGVLSYAGDPDADLYFINDTPWVRSFGAGVLYDWAPASIVMYVDTFRAQFEYGGLEWKVQGWKGQYGFLFVGSEIGIFTKDPSTGGYVGADDEHMIEMEMSVDLDAHDGAGYRKLFTRASAPHWWTNGFVEGHLAEYKFNDRTCMIQTARLTTADPEMAEALADALENDVGFKRVSSAAEVTNDDPDTFAVDGAQIVYAWKTIDQGYRNR